MFYKRANFLINKRFQLRFAFFVCSWIFALSMVYPIVIYNIFEYFLNLLSSNENISITLDRVKTIENEILVILGVLQLLFLAITFMISIFISHRIAGPLFKLRKSMEEVTHGNLDQRISFRKTDHFFEMQNTFNDMVQSLTVHQQDNEKKQ